MATAQADFYGDWVETLSERLKKMGHPPQPGSNQEDIAFAYFNLLRRKIPALPRRVECAREFSCPSVMQARLDYLTKKIEHGENLTPHLSTSVGRNAGYNDMLLNDWGIHHLHLGTTFRSDGFIDRTGPVLFAKFDKDTAYFVKIAEHGEWSDREAVEVLNSNWPHLTQRTKLQGVDSLESQASSDEIALLRKSGVNVILQMPGGSVHAPIGGGYASDGSSIEAVEQHDRIALSLKKAERILKTQIDEIIADARQSGFDIHENPVFKLLVEPAELFAIESETGFKIPIQQLFRAGK